MTRECHVRFRESLGGKLPWATRLDDRQENMRAIEAVLEGQGYEIVSALSGEAALKELLRNDFALILLDVQMPGLDGFETASLIRKRQKSRFVPIIFVTAINKEEQYVYKGYGMGAVDYLFKPLDVDILRAKVAVFADLFRKNQQIKAQARLLQESERRERIHQVADIQRRGDHRYRNLADFMPHMVWTADADGRIDYVNRCAAEYAGVKCDSVVEIEICEVVHADDLHARLGEWRKALMAGDSLTVELRIRRMRDLQYRWHLVHIRPNRDDQGRVRSWLGTATDIHDQRTATEALAAERERLSVTLRSIGDGVITTDENSRIVLVNKAAELLTGWSQEDAVGQLLHTVFVVREGFLYTAGDRGRAEMTRWATLVARDGRERYIADCVAPIRDGQGCVSGTAVVFRDVTDVQRLEEERQKASRLESVGVLAGAIAHDFNNILTAIMGNISLAKLYTTAGDRIFERLSEAERAASWAKDLTHQLLTFAKGSAPVKKPIDIGTVVRNSAEFACRGSRVLCEVAVNGALVVEADEGQVRQVIHNLVLNAQQAMPDGGRVRVSVHEVTLPIRGVQSLPPGRYVEISCEDNGIGISAEHLQKIFDPYFTTKQNGSGLGLATSYSIIRKHGGLITVASQVDIGTVFQIYLPLSDKGAGCNDIINVPARAGHGRILVMDDEYFIRDMLGRLFAHFGYEVGFAKDGDEALSIYKAAHVDGHPYGLVIMDLVIPGGMGGRETIGQLLAFDPHAKVIVSSGYANDPVMADWERYGFCEAVIKPYSNDQLHTIVQRLLAH
ncbi:MAG: response regulator [Acidiferrobacter sp.]